jgi:hypothetical protein
MSKGIIYIMTTAVPGLIKIGKTNTANYKDRMYNLEQNGYRNVTGLNRAFAIEVENFDAKESMLHNIFEKSQLANTELFSVDANLAIQLLSSFEGKIIYPEETDAQNEFGTTETNRSSECIPDGIYTLHLKRTGDSLPVHATARVENGHWTLLSGSQCGITEPRYISNTARAKHAELPLTESGRLKADFELGKCSPSFAGAVATYDNPNGWTRWKDASGEAIDKYRNSSSEE